MKLLPEKSQTRGWFDRGQPVPPGWPSPAEVSEQPASRIYSKTQRREETYSLQKQNQEGKEGSLFIKPGVLLQWVAEEAIESGVEVGLLVEGIQELDVAVPERMREEVPANLLGSSLENTTKGARGEKGESREKKERERRGKKKEI